MNEDTKSMHRMSKAGETKSVRTGVSDVSQTFSNREGEVKYELTGFIDNNFSNIFNFKT